jgi:hypothetical protein
LDPLPLGEPTTPLAMTYLLAQALNRPCD